MVLTSRAARCALLFVGLGVLLMPSAALALPDPVDTVMNTVVSSAKGWIPVMQGYARGVFLLLAVIQIAYSALRQATLGSGDIGAGVGAIVLEMLHLGFFAVLVSEGPGWAEAIIQSLQEAGKAAAGGGAAEAPQKVLNDVAELCVKVIEDLSLLNGFQSGIAVFVGCGLLLLLVVLIAGLILVGWAQAWIVVGAGTILLGLGGSHFTRPIAVSYLRYALGSGVKLMVLELLTGVVLGQVREWVIQADGGIGFGFELIVHMVISLGVLGVLIVSVPSYVSAIVTGSVTNGAEAFVMRAGAAAAMFMGGKAAMAKAAAASAGGGAAPASAASGAAGGGRGASESPGLVGQGLASAGSVSTAPAASSRARAGGAGGAPSGATAGAAARASGAGLGGAGDTGGAAPAGLGAAPRTASSSGGVGTGSGSAVGVPPAQTPAPSAQAHRPSGGRETDAPSSGAAATATGASSEGRGPGASEGAVGTPASAPGRSSGAEVLRTAGSSMARSMGGSGGASPVQPVLSSKAASSSAASSMGASSMGASSMAAPSGGGSGTAAPGLSLGGGAAAGGVSATGGAGGAARGSAPGGGVGAGSARAAQGEGAAGGAAGGVMEGGGAGLGAVGSAPAAAPPPSPVSHGSAPSSGRGAGRPLAAPRAATPIPSRLERALSVDEEMADD